MSRPTWGSGGGPRALRRRGSHPLRRRFPAAPARAADPVSRPRNPGGQARRFGLGPISLTATHGIASCFLLLRLLRCFTSPGSRRTDYRFVRRHRPWTVGCPIRTPPDQRPHASPRGFSQLAASFIACRRQGIRHAPEHPGRLESLPGAADTRAPRSRGGLPLPWQSHPAAPRLQAPPRRSSTASCLLSLLSFKRNRFRFGKKLLLSCPSGCQRTRGRLERPPQKIAVRACGAGGRGGGRTWTRTMDLVLIRDAL